MMKTYERYKPSGVEWIGDIPEHWKIEPVRHLLKIGKEGIKIGPFGSSLKPEHLSLSGYKIYGQENVIKNDFKLGWRFINDRKFEELSDYEIKPDDILVTMMGTTGKCKVVPDSIEHGIIDSHLIRLRINEEKFLPHLFSVLINSSHYVFHQLKLLSKGSIMEGLNTTTIKNLLLLVPPLSEQATIANYLDEKTAHLDKLIEGKGRLIALLKEERSGVINNAVTRGINPQAKLKPSGIDWLGEIPEHWEVKKLKYVCELLKDGTHLPPPRVQDGIPLLSVRNLVDGKFIKFLDDDSRISEEDFVQLEKVFKVKEDDILLAIVGATMGKVSLVPKMQRFTIQRSVAIFRTIEEIIYFKFLFYFFLSNSFQSILWNNTGFSAQPGIYLGALANFSCSCPSIEEQKQIVQFIEAETAKIDATIAKIEKEIEYLLEYRTALISEVVTGKIDVRQAEATADVIPMRAPANPYFRRTVLTTEIVHQLHAHPTFGHVKLMKLLHLAEYHGQLSEMESQYYRQAAGPYDYRLLDSVEKQMEQNKWYKVIGNRGEQHRYLPLEKAGTHHKYYDNCWGEKRDVIQWLIDLSRDLSTQQCEIVATLYAAWNDFLIARKPASDNEIINEVLTNWRDEKRLIADWQWRNALAWMREKGLVPTGFGKLTLHSPPQRRKKR
jgi:type I restriction enzyme S subunit